jgi:hypothetical protein
MKLWKYGIACVALCILTCTSSTASAISVSDPTGDVTYGDESGPIAQVDNRSNVDITQLSAIVNGDSVTLSLTVAGTIEISPDVLYLAYVNSTDTQYSIALNHDSRAGISMNRNTKEMKYTNGSVTVTGNTLSAVFNLDGITSMVVLSAFTQAVKRYSTGRLALVWFDNASYMNINDSTDTNTNTSNNTDGNNTNDNTVTSTGKNTPGFELLLVIAAVTITVILLKRRR